MYTENKTSKSVDECRIRLRSLAGQAKDVTFLRGWGNLGDELIWAGTRALLVDIPYREESIRDVRSLKGDLALVTGGGGWCQPFHRIPDLLPLIESRFNSVIVLPTSFDVSVPIVWRTLDSTEALVFAREWVSYDGVQSLCKAEFAHDCAFYFDYEPYKIPGRGTLNCFRTDKEASGAPLPADNDDISLTASSLDHWLWRIAKSEHIRTDRAHVVVAASLLGKTVEYRPSSYHKIPAIIAASLQGYPVTPLSDHLLLKIGDDVPIPMTPSMEFVTSELASCVPDSLNLIKVDDNYWTELDLAGRTTLPFLERDGHYWGPPSDDITAVLELERMRREGSAFIVFVWPALWWLDYYEGFTRYLDERYERILDNEWIKVYDLR